ncbi:hypothetical protein F3D3_3065 [Fusibacter sp. 3D3]|nr:hypothetical protein F3D3_3065 [Fusibacter sp. 3D3]
MTDDPLGTQNKTRITLLNQTIAKLLYSFQLLLPVCKYEK